MNDYYINSNHKNQTARVSVYFEEYLTNAAAVATFFFFNVSVWHACCGKCLVRSGRLSGRKAHPGDMSDTNIDLKSAFDVFVLNQDGCHFMANLLTQTYILYYICIPVFIAYQVLQLQG